MPCLIKHEDFALFNKIPSFVFVCDFSNQTIIYSNRSFLDELGYLKNTSGFEEGDWKKLIHPDDLIVYNQMESSFFKPGVSSKSISCNVRLKHSNGGWVWYLLNSSALEHLPDGSVSKGIIILSENSSMAELYYSLSESNDRFKTLANASFGGIGIHDNGIIIEANQELARMTGYEHHELIGMDGLQLIEQDSRELVMSKILSGFENPYEAVGMRKDGSTYALEIQGKQIPFKGKTVRVTEFRNIEERKIAKQAMEEMEQTYENLFEFAVDGILIGNPQGVVIKANQKFLEISGRKREEVEGFHISTLFPQTTLNAKPLRFDVLKSGVKLVNEREILKPTGQKVFVEMHSRMMPDGTYHSIIRDVTERMASENALKESENLFRSIFEKANDAIFIMNSEVFLDCNARTEKMFGLPKEKIVGHSPVEFSPEFQFDGSISTQKAREKIDLAIAGEPQFFEWIHLRGDGSPFFTEVSLNIVVIEGKSLVQAIVRDIDERKKSEQALQTSENLYRSIIENITDIYYRFDTNQRLTMISPSAVQLLGYNSVDEMLGLSVDTFWKNAEHRTAFTEMLRKHGQIKNFETVVVNKNRNEIHVALSAVYLKGKQGEKLGFEGIIRDISKRKKFEMELSTEQFYMQTLMNNLTDQIYFKDKESKFLRVNMNVAKRFGLNSPQEACGKTDFDYFAPDHAMHAFKVERRIMATGESVINAEEEEKWPDGSATWVSTTKMPLRNSKGEIVGTFGVSRDITDRKRAEEAIKVSEERLRMVIEATNEGIWDWDLTTNLTFYSDRYYTMLGYEPGEFEGNYDNWHKLVHPEDIGRIEAKIQKCIQNQHEEFEGEFRMKEKNGCWRWIHAKGKVVAFDKYGKPSRLLGSHEDINDRKKAEEELHQSYARTNALISAIPDLMFIFNKEGVFEDFFTPKNEELLLPPEVFIGKHVSEVLPKHVSSLTEKHLAILFETGEKQFFDYQLEIEDQNKMYEARMVKIDDSRAITICRDVTERRRSEDAIELERAYFEHLFDSSPEGIVILNANDQIIRCNDEFSRLFGYSMEEVQGQSINKLIVPDNLLEEGQNLTSVVTSGSLIVHETVRKRKDGSLVPVSIMGKPIQFKGGQIAVYGIYQDITQRKKVEEELIRKNYEIETQNEEYRIINEELHVAKEKAEESDRLKSAFLANMSHEIRTPMNGILGFSQLLTNSDVGEIDTKQYVDVIQSCSNQLLTIINDLIDISKIEANQLVITESEVDLNKMLLEQYLLFEKKAEFKNIAFSYSAGLKDSQSIIITDGARLMQVMSNLLSNALKFIHAGHVKFGYTLQGSKLEFYVEDTGIGIPKEFIGVVFERFRQVETKLSAQAGGTGLGLAISKAFVNKMGGELWVHSEIDKGSTFYFTIPYRPVMKENKESMKESFFEEKLQGISKTVLVAEDDDVNYFYLSELLSEYSLNLIRAKTGKEAIEIVRNNPNVNLVLMDIKMPDIDGHEATKTIKTIRNSIPIIAQTAYAFSADREKAMEVGCNDYISKPIQKGKLISMLVKYLHD